MSVPDGPESWDSSSPPGRPSVDAGALGDLPALTRRQARLEGRLGPGGSRLGPGGLMASVAELLGQEIEADRFEVAWRAAGLRRPGAIAQFTWPRLSTRVGVGIEPPLAHALVDRLLGHERPTAEGRLQVTPVEWGILSFVMARALDRLDESPGPLGPWDLTLDRLGPDPFDPAGLGPIVTWRWRVRLGPAVASARLWLSESLLSLWLVEDPSQIRPPHPIARFAGLAADWVARGGTISLPRGLAKLRPGLLLLIDGAPLSGPPESPVGPIELALDGPAGRWSCPARAEPGSNLSRLILDSPPRREPDLREPSPMPPSLEPAASPDAPVTLAVELGRVSLPLHRLADLKPGDVIELGRHPREPVELTSGGRLVARGELVQVDTELAVRVMQVFL